MINKTILFNALLSVQPLALEILENYSINIDDFLNIILKFEGYSLNTELNISSVKAAKLTKYLLPNKPRNSSKVHTYLLLECGLKYCSCCKNILDIECFYKNKSRPNGLSTFCSTCQKAAFKKWYIADNGVTSKQHNISRRSLLKRVCPTWADNVEIRKVYKNCPTDMAVDHIVPLKGELVCGLHVHNNLQYLSKSDNSKKKNSWQV